MLNVFTDPIVEGGQHTRYILVYPDGPAVVGIDGLLQHFADENLTAAVAISADGSAEPVTVQQTGDSQYAVYQHDGDGLVEAAYVDASGHVYHSERYIEGFTDDSLPTYMAGLNRH